MAEQKLNGADVRSRFQEMHSEAVAHGMGGYRLPDAGTAAGFLASLFHCGRGDGPSGYHTVEEPATLRPDRPPITAQRFQQLWREHDVAILLPLTLFNTNHHSLAVNVSGLQVNGLGD